MRNGMTTMMIEIEPELKDEFKEVSKKEDLNMSQIVRRMIKEYLARVKMESK